MTTETSEEEIPVPPPLPNNRNLVGTDIYICNLENKSGFNGVGARCMQWHPTKGRYEVRIHYTGRTLLVKPNCVIQGDGVTVTDCGIITGSICHPGRVEINTRKLKMIKPEEVVEGCGGYIKRNARVRRILSQRVKEGYLAKGPGKVRVCHVAEIC